MPTFRVAVARAYWHHATIEVEAEDSPQAESIAYERMNDVELKLGEAFEGNDYAITLDEVKA